MIGRLQILSPHNCGHGSGWGGRHLTVYTITMKMNAIPGKLQIWVEARNRYHLSHAQVQMARELGLNPKKFGGLANDKQEPWKLPLPSSLGVCT